MKKLYSLFSVVFLLLLSLGLEAQEKLIISEVADPSNIANAKFVELYNTGSASINFETETYYLARQANGGSWANIKLTGTISPYGTYVLAYTSTEFAHA